VEEGQNAELLIATTVRPSSATILNAFDVAGLEKISHHVAMGQADTFGQAGCTGGVDEEGQIRGRVDWGPDVWRFVTAADSCEMRVFARHLTVLGPEEDNVVWGKAGFLSSYESSLKISRLSDQGLRRRVGELESKLICGIKRIGGRNHAACPESAKCEDWGLGIC